MPELLEQDSTLIRMKEDLERALQKPANERRWTMVIDLRKCVGCHACTVSCIAENKLPPGVIYQPVTEEETGTYPDARQSFLPVPCMHCDNPWCMTACPVSAISKRADGIVAIDYTICDGSRDCIGACPYSAISFDAGGTYTEDTPQQMAYEILANFEYGAEWPRSDGQPPIGRSRKCHFCIHRLKEGRLPACIGTCIGRANYFGDANDSQSLVSELIALPNAIRLREELGTGPNVYYLVEESSD